MIRLKINNCCNFINGIDDMRILNTRGYDGIHAII